MTQPTAQRVIFRRLYYPAWDIVIKWHEQAESGWLIRVYLN